MSNQIVSTEVKKIVVRNLKGNEIDLKEIFIDLNIYESIFSPFKTGHINIKDVNDLINLFPFVGGEEIEIYFTSKGDNSVQKSKIQKFVVYKISPDLNVQTGAEVKNIFKLFFCSPEMILSEKLNICRRFSYKTPELIEFLIRTVLKSGKAIYHDDPENILNFVSNFWSPLKIINFIESRSKSDFHDFIFFENMNGFNFKSISNLMNQEHSHTVIFEDSLAMLYRNDVVKGKTFTNYFNDLEALKFGSYGNTVYELSDISYGFNKFQNDFKTMTQFNTSLGKNVQHREEMINNNNIQLSHSDGQHNSKRDLIIKALSNYHMVLKMNGDSTKTVGQVFDFSINKRIKNKDELNFLLTGKWFVTHINHNLLNDGVFNQNIKIVKNAFHYFDVFSLTQGRQNL